MTTAMPTLGGSFSDQDTPVELTVLIPCLNEAGTVVNCIQRARDYMQRAGVVGEVLVADNNSSDGSRELAHAAGARVILVTERGYGSALRTGISAARGRYVIMGDADESYDFSSLDAFVSELRGGAELVMGNRFEGGIKPGAMPFLHRYLGNPVLSLLGRMFFQTQVRDFHCGLRGFHREAILGLALASPGMEFASEMIVKACLRDLRISEVPTVLWPDKRGRPPHLRTWRDGWRHLRFLLLHSPSWLFLYPGVCLLGVASILTITLAFRPISIGSVTLDVHTLLYAMAASCLGLQMVVFGIASFMHAVAQGVLPAYPAFLRRAASTTLEQYLILGLLVFLCGGALAAFSLSLWFESGFAGMDPSRLMRVAIPAAGLMLAGAQIATGAFMLEFVRGKRAGR